MRSTGHESVSGFLSHLGSSTRFDTSFVLSRVQMPQVAQYNVHYVCVLATDDCFQLVPTDPLSMQMAKSRCQEGKEVTLVLHLSLFCYLECSIILYSMCSLCVLYYMPFLSLVIIRLLARNGTHLPVLLSLEREQSVLLLKHVSCLSRQNSNSLSSSSFSPLLLQLQVQVQLLF